eukprot:scaffold6653_cov105-Phaeocystis_antarctica.AAC.1
MDHSWKRDYARKRDHARSGAMQFSRGHGGVLATKVGYFGVKSTNVLLAAEGTKPAKVAHRPSWPTKATKPGLFPRDRRPFCKKVFAPRARTKVANCGLPGRSGGIKSAKVPPTPYV